MGLKRNKEQSHQRSRYENIEAVYGRKEIATDDQAWGTEIRLKDAYHS